MIRVVQANATIKKIHLHEFKKELFKKDVSYTGEEGTYDFNLPDWICKGPLIMSVFVDFDGDDGEVIFGGAGAWFNEE